MACCVGRLLWFTLHHTCFTMAQPKCNKGAPRKDPHRACIISACQAVGHCHSLVGNQGQHTGLLGKAQQASLLNLAQAEASLLQLGQQASLLDLQATMK